MSVSRTWKVEGIDVRPTADGLANVVSQIQWSLTMEQTNEEGAVLARTVSNGYSHLDAPNANNFITLDSITEEQLLTWAKDALGEKVKEFETHTYNLTINQTSNTLTRMIFNESGKIVEAPQDPSS